MNVEKKIRALIADDEAPARLRLRRLLEMERDVEILGECSSGRQAVNAIQKQRPDLVFLDVQMPKLNGFDVCATISKEFLPLVIFVTAYDQYALKAFEVHAIDYLLKPFDRDRFQRALRHARQQLTRDEAEGPSRQVAALLADLKSGKRSERLAFKSNGRIILLRADEIDWAEADGNYVRLHAGQNSHFIRETMSWLETQLGEEQFVRVNRSALVNLDRVRELHSLFYGDYTVVLADGTKITMTRNYRDRFQKLFSGR
jgi:two-component system LytT family response regulator